MSGRVALALALALSGLAPTAARAFNDPADFGRPAATGGGGGRYFTGAPGDGFTCEVCHVSEEDPGPTSLEGLPEDGWIPNTTYTLTIDLPHEDGVVNSAAALEIVDGLGAPVGTLTPTPTEADGVVSQEECPAPPPMPEYPAVTIRGAEEGREVAIADQCGASAFRVTWQAPPEPISRVTVYAVAVHGDTDTFPVPVPGEGFAGDLTFIAALPFPPAGDAPEGPRVDNACAASPGPADRSTAALLPLFALALLCARRR